MSGFQLCPRCYRTNPAPARFCALCGTPLITGRVDGVAGDNHPVRPSHGLGFALILVLVALVLLGLFLTQVRMSHYPVRRQWFHETRYPPALRESHSPPSSGIGPWEVERRFHDPRLHHH